MVSNSDIGVCFTVAIVEPSPGDLTRRDITEIARFRVDLELIAFGKRRNGPIKCPTEHCWTIRATTGRKERVVVVSMVEVGLDIFIS
jgi:hypothetical protein